MGELLQKRMKGKANTNGFAKNPENIVPGRPKKGISLFIKQCEDGGIEQANKRDIEATYLSLVNMTLEELKVVGEDKKQPIIVRKLAEFIVKAKDINVIETMLDRGIGKAVQKEDINHTGEITISKIEIINPN